MDLYLGIDLGGSHLEVGVIESGGKVILTRENDLNSTDVTAVDVVNMVKAHVASLLNELQASNNCHIVAAGIGCPGQTVGDILVAASNFPKFINVPFVRLLSEALGGIPVTLLNDADAAISAEVWGNPDRFLGISP